MVTAVEPDRVEVRLVQDYGSTTEPPAAEPRVAA
jgi:hypothetical protein